MVTSREHHRPVVAYRVPSGDRQRRRAAVTAPSREILDHVTHFFAAAHTEIKGNPVLLRRGHRDEKLDQRKMRWTSSSQ